VNKSIRVTTHLLQVNYTKLSKRDVKVKDRVPRKELRARLGIDLGTTAKQAAMI